MARRIVMKALYRIGTFVFFALCLSTQVAAQEITVAGTVTLKKAPELATFEMSVDGKGKSGDVAQAEMLKNLTGVQGSIRLLGLTVYTTGYRVTEDIEYQYDQKTSQNRRIVVGFIASTGYHIRVDDLAKLPKALTLSNLRGVSRVTSLTFDIRDHATAEREARAAAVQNALANAEAVAKGAGGKGIKVMKIQQNGVEFRNPFQVLNLPMDSIRSGGKGILDDDQYGPVRDAGIAAVMGADLQFADTILVPTDMEITASVVMAVQIQ